MPATPTAQKQNNLYKLQGGDLQIEYATMGADGMPYFHYTDPSQPPGFQYRSFVGDEIQTIASTIGTLVTIRIILTPDRGYTSFTLLVPQVSFDQTKQAPVSTVGIKTEHRLLMSNRGQIDLYTVTDLTGAVENFNPDSTPVGR